MFQWLIFCSNYNQIPGLNIYQNDDAGLQLIGGRGQILEQF